MKKHLRIFLTTITLTFSFCFITSVKAFTQDDYEHLTLDTVREIALKAFDNDTNFVDNIMNNRYKYCYVESIGNSGEIRQIQCYFFPSTNYLVTQRTGYAYNGYSISNIVWFSLNLQEGSLNKDTNKTYSSANLSWYNQNNRYPMQNPWSNNYIRASFADSNFKLNDSNSSFLSWTDTDSYDPILKYTVNFHLNGGTVSDFSDPEHFNFIELDYQIQTTSEELAEYISFSIIPYREDYYFVGWYYDSDFTNMYDGNDDLTSNIDLYAKWEYAMPDYLHGYKRVTLTPENKYVMISYVDSGSVFIPTEEFYKYGGRVSYYDNDLEIQPYVSYIQDYTEMPDGLFIRQDFDLSTYNGADWVMFSKYIYLEGEDNISYYVYVPEDSYNSQIVITPNEQGGNNFDFTYKDENGDIQTGQVVSEDISNTSLSTSDIFGEISIFLNKMKRATTSIKEIFTYLFNSLNSTIKSFIIFVIVLILVSTVIRFARRG